MAEEVHHIYPEGEWSLSQLAEDPGHLLFKAYGALVPEADWNHPGTKQGIYMMGPNGEYLEGAHATSGHADRLVERLKRGLKRWDALRKDKKYEALPVPRAAAVGPPEIESAPMALRISLRDLPRGKRDQSGRRREKSDLRGRHWMSFTEWAWNQNWMTIEDPAALVPAADQLELIAVADTTVQRIVRRALVDNVRGQNPAWKPEHVKSATLNMRATSVTDERIEIEYTGAAECVAGPKRYAPTLHGRATWDREADAFVSFQLVAIGERAGAARFNQRAEDKSPAPMGVLLELHSVPSESE